MEQRNWMAEVIPELPWLLVDDSAGEALSVWKTLPEVEAALERAYLRGDRGSALVAAWREADISPALIAQVDTELARKAAAQAEIKGKLEVAREALAAVAKMRRQSSPGESTSASPRESASAPQKKNPSKNTPEQEDGYSKDAPGDTASKAKKPAKSNQTSQSAPGASSSALTKKFGEAIMDDGFTGVPNLLLKHQKQLKLSHLDMLLIIHLFSFWFDSAGSIWPSKATLAARLNATECTVRRSVVRMEDMGYVKRIVRRGKEGGNTTNVYDLSGLIAKLNELAAPKAAA